MKKITLNETDLLTIVNQVLNEHKDRQFNEDEIGLLHWIFERELKPPFKEGKKGSLEYYPYYNRDNEIIGWLRKDTLVINGKLMNNVKDKVCQVFEVSEYNWVWWFAIKNHFKPWMESQINMELDGLSL